MTLDRIITVTYTPPGHRNNDGIYVEPPPVVHTVWAQVTPLSLTDIAEAGGSIGQARRRWRIRWIDGLTTYDTRMLTVTDGQRLDTDGNLVDWVFSVENLVEYTGRNSEFRERWIDIEGLYAD